MLSKSRENDYRPSLRKMTGSFRATASVLPFVNAVMLDTSQDDHSHDYTLLCTSGDAFPRRGVISITDDCDNTL